MFEPVSGIQTKVIEMEAFVKTLMKQVKVSKRMRVWHDSREYKEKGSKQHNKCTCRTEGPMLLMLGINMQPA